MSLIRVTCCQADLAVGDVPHNRAVVTAAAESAARSGADVVVLPELANSGYVFRDAAEAEALAEPLDGPTVAGWEELCRRHNLTLVGGLCERGENTLLHNSAVVVDPEGLRAVYRKVHLWDREGLVFTAGTQPPPVVHTAAGRIGVMICYDLEFPEWVRLPALAGSELLCLPVNWTCSPAPAGERPLEIVRAQAAAAANRIFLAACDRRGEERGTDWVGGSVVLDPDGWPLAGPACERPGPLAADCDLSAARDKRINDHNDVHADRRPELYGDLAHRAASPSTPLHTGTQQHD